MEQLIKVNKDTSPILFGTTKVITIPNLFEDYTNKIEVIALHGRPVKSYIKNYSEESEDINYVVYINDRIVEDLNKIVEQSDVVLIFPYAGKSGIGKAIGAIVVAIASYYTAGAVGAAYGSLAGAVAGAVVTAAGGLILNSIFPPEVLGSSISKNFSESKQYGFRGITTSREAFRPIPVLYGEFHLGGTEINKRISYENGDDWMEIQLALCYGLINEITEDDIYINGQSFKNVANQGNTIDTYWGYTDGAFDQPIINGFGDKNFINTDVKKRLVYNEDYIFETSSNLIDNFEVHIASSEAGIHTADAQGGLKSKSVTLEMSYRKKGDTIWIPIQEPTDVFVTEYEYELIPVYKDNGEGSSSSGGWSSGGGFGGYGGLSTGTGATGGMLA